MTNSKKSWDNFVTLATDPGKHALKNALPHHFNETFGKDKSIGHRIKSFGYMAFSAIVGPPLYLLNVPMRAKDIGRGIKNLFNIFRPKQSHLPKTNQRHTQNNTEISIAEREDLYDKNLSPQRGTNQVRHQHSTKRDKNTGFAERLKNDKNNPQNLQRNC